MAKLEPAADRLMAAVQGLEAQVAPLAGLRAQAEKDKAEIAELRAERDRLLARVAELESEGRDLAGVTSEVEERLDSAVSEIRAALAR